MHKSYALTISLRLAVAFTLLCGGFYPLTVTLLSHLLFPERSSGSLIHIDGRLVGSELLAQDWSGPTFFHARPSAAGYATVPSAASNFGPTSAALRDSIYPRQLRFQKENGLGTNTVVPIEMLCTSGSGLDPHISPEAARYQVGRIAEQRGLDPNQTEQLYQLIVRMTEPRQWSIFGEPRVNVFKLNLMLNSRPEFCNLKQLYPK